MFFVGTYELTIDSKNRLSIPHTIRSKINSDQDGRSFYVLPGRRRDVLAVYPERYFEHMRRTVIPEPSLSQHGNDWRQFEFAQCALIDPDSQGRILIPERLLTRSGIGSKVTLIGVQDHLEIWDREAFNKFQDACWADYETGRTAAMNELRQLAESNGSSASDHDDD
ncbi:MAG: hypothetical protein D6744_15340 [Planctomycetota bacterium]|nr:MAG: hypothetical protein D6744_15340 [Planctomycetota bacterium]